MRFLLAFVLATAACAASVRPLDAGEAGMTAPSDFPITFEQAGGFAARDVRYALTADGTVMATDVLGGATTTLHAPNGASDATALSRSIAATGVYDVAPGDYRPMNRCCDRIEDTLVLVHGGRTLTYRAMSDGAGAPAAVLAAMRVVNEYVTGAH